MVPLPGPEWGSSPRFLPRDSSRNPVKRRRFETQFPGFENVIFTGDIVVIPAAANRVQNAGENACKSEYISGFRPKNDASHSRIALFF